MKQTMHVLPVRCKQCNAVFDLWYDLQEQEQTDVISLSDSHSLNSVMRQTLCWRCRQTASEKLIANENGDDYDMEEEPYEVVYKF